MQNSDPSEEKRIFKSGKRTALVVQGGGLRGAYTVGVLRKLYEYGGPNQFDAIYAVSCGVFAATFFAAGQVEQMENIWRDRVHGSQLVDYWNLWSHLSQLWGKPVTKPVMKLEYLIDVFKGPSFLDLNKVFSAKPTITYVVTNYQTGNAHYADAKCPQIFDLMRASSAMPGAYPRPVEVNGVFYTDGGNSDPIPVKQAIKDGFNDILVILTRHHGFRKSHPSQLLAKICYPHNRKAQEAFLRSDACYNEALDTIENPLSGVNIIAARPHKPLTIHRLSRDRKTIIDTIEHGKEDASILFESLLTKNGCAERVAA
jgi:predicted patatin/cPLA2 family phospholipase